MYQDIVTGMGTFFIILFSFLFGWWINRNISLHNKSYWEKKQLKGGKKIVEFGHKVPNGTIFLFGNNSGCEHM